MKTEFTAKRLLELQQFLFDFTQIDRLIYFPDDKRIDRFENNTEHSFSLALAAWYLAASYPHLDSNLLVKYALIHDLVEIHAGDVQAIGRTEAEQAAKHTRELAALKKLKKEWPDFSDMTSHIENYEKREDAESKFIYALDKLMPMMLNILSEGKTWKKYNFNKQEVLSAKDEKVIVSPEIEELWKVFRAQIDNRNSYFNERKNLDVTS